MERYVANHSMVNLKFEDFWIQVIRLRVLENKAHLNLYGRDPEVTDHKHDIYYNKYQHCCIERYSYSDKHQKDKFVHNLYGSQNIFQLRYGVSYSEACKLVEAKNGDSGFYDADYLAFESRCLFENGLAAIPTESS